ncbi:GGDEF domain-containing protein [Lysinibacillus sp. LZ02]|uniref:GGDEF domain-containing protein n=1 Tax=Lysinibacillus sp. LZ02 TaxID=3420668 RepID=UPI003D35BBFA
MSIENIIQTVPCIDEYTKSKKVDQLFVEDPTLRGIVVLREEKPIGHISRTHFYEKIGTKYGYNLYMGRECSLLYKSSALVVDYAMPITDISQLAMKREEPDLYDDIIVTKEHCFKGVVSIRALLLKLAETQVRIASFMNPLSHLPGNHVIEQKMQELLDLPNYSLIYFDLDHFKKYNDLYGFKKGDKMLLYLTDILKHFINMPNMFLGHIGGDDFVAIVPHYDVAPLCSNIIEAFDQNIRKFYDDFHLHQNLLVPGRNGELEPFTVSSLSVAVVTNEYKQYDSIEHLATTAALVKKHCKKIKGSCFLINEPIYS